MSSALTRRDFLRALIPGWLTARNLKVAAIGITAFLVAGYALAAVRSLTPLGTLRFLGLTLLAGLGLWLLVRLAHAFTAVSHRFPPLLSAFFTVAARFVGLAIIAALGIYGYIRWQTGADLTGTAISLAIFFALSLRDEWKRRTRSPAQS